MKDGKAILTTMTGEVYQPIRVYYEVRNRQTVTAALSTLRCMEMDPPNRRWVWLYRAEAKKLGLDRSYRSIPRKMRPIVLGSLFFKGNRRMHVDLGSFERATKLIVFLGKHLHPFLAKVTDVAVVNRLSDINTKVPPNHDRYFRDVDLRGTTRDDLLGEMDRIREIEDPQQRAELAAAVLERGARQKLPEVEKTPTNFYEDGSGSLELALRIRQLVAIEHWKGNLDCTVADIIDRRGFSL